MRDGLMKSFKVIFCVVISIFFFPGISSAHQNGKVCSLDAAYSAGVKDANRDKDKRDDYSEPCEALLNKKYRQGYHDASNDSDTHHDGSHDQPKKQCLDHFGEKVCGYDCKKNVTNVMCAPKPNQQCIKGSFDEIACGFSCVKSGMSIKCATKHKYTCVAGSFDEIKCGKNCRKSFGHIECDEYDLGS